MSAQRRWQHHGFRRFFQGAAPDVVGLLVARGDISVLATAAFLEWSRGSGSAEALTALESQTDQARPKLLAALRSALVTPIDQEDVYVLSERCDRVVNVVRDITVEAEALAWRPDRHAALMAGHLHDGMPALVDGFAKLRHDFDQAGVAADQARAQARSVVGRYWDAIAAIYRSDDLQAAVIGRELYRPCTSARAADRLEAVADRLWYVVLADV